ncbi:MAG: LuxR C-terminal-related transcriptional regulator [Acidimicrobiaceae bacterium]
MPLLNPHSPERAEREYLDSVLSHLAKARAALDIACENVASNLTKDQLKTADLELTAVINSLTPHVLSQQDLEHLQIRESRRAQENMRVQQLNAQELRVFALLAEGMSNKEIAQTINLSQNTIRNYVSMILDKLGLSNRTEIALVSQRRSDEL